jgi:hypothetical protein
LILALAGILGTASFLFIDNYNPHLGILWNVMNGTITVIDMEWGSLPKNVLCFGNPGWFGNPDDPDPKCRHLMHWKWTIEYRWVAALCIGLVGYAGFLRFTKK